MRALILQYLEHRKDKAYVQRILAQGDGVDFLNTIAAIVREQDFDQCDNALSLLTDIFREDELQLDDDKSKLGPLLPGSNLAEQLIACLYCDQLRLRMRAIEAAAYSVFPGFQKHLLNALAHYLKEDPVCARLTIADLSSFAIFDPALARLCTEHPRWLFRLAGLMLLEIMNIMFPFRATVNMHRKMLWDENKFVRDVARHDCRTFLWWRISYHVPFYRAQYPIHAGSFSPLEISFRDYLLDTGRPDYTLEEFEDFAVEYIPAATRFFKEL